MINLLILLLAGTIAVSTCKGETVVAREIQAQIKCDYDFTRLRKGTNIHDESQEHPYYKEFPKSLNGEKIMVRDFKSTEPIEFEVEKEGLVTLVVAKTRSGNSPNKLIKEGWVETDKIVISWYDGSTMDLLVLQKKLPEGSYSFPCLSELGIRLLKLRSI